MAKECFTFSDMLDFDPEFNGRIRDLLSLQMLKVSRNVATKHMPSKSLPHR